MHETPTIVDIVNKDYRTAEVFHKWGINYCCGGKLTLQEVCKNQQLPLAEIQQELKQVASGYMAPASVDFSTWPIAFLIDYVTYLHHEYLKKTIPAIQQLLQSFVPGHLKKYPYLKDVEEAFLHLAEELQRHNEIEEESIFPYLRQVEHAFKAGEKYGGLFVRTLRKPVADMVQNDHRRIALLMKNLQDVTHQFSYADDVCTRHKVIYCKLKELNNDLVQHKYLENQFLFPKAIAMEKSLLELPAS